MKKKVFFVSHRFGNEPISIAFYDEDGNEVKPENVKRNKKKKVIEFYKVEEIGEVKNANPPLVHQSSSK